VGFILSNEQWIEGVWKQSKEENILT